MNKLVVTGHAERLAALTLEPTTNTSSVAAELRGVHNPWSFGPEAQLPTPTAISSAYQHC